MIELVVWTLAGGALGYVIGYRRAERKARRRRFGFHVLHADPSQVHRVLDVTRRRLGVLGTLERRRVAEGEDMRH